MYKRFKVKIKPTQEQVDLIEKTFGCTRFIWNQMLNERQTVYESLGNNRESLYAHKYLTEKDYKQQYLFLSEISSYALQSTRKDLQEAYKKAFDRLKKGKKTGFPKFKSKKGKQAFRMPNVHNEIRFLDNTTLKLPKLKGVRLTYLPKNFKGEIQSVTVKKEHGKYYVSILCKIDDAEVKKERSGDGITGVDFGLKNFITTSTGDVIYGLKNVLYDVDKRIVKMNRALSRKKKGSKRREKCRRKLSSLYEYKTNRLSHFQWHLANHLCNENQVVVIEDLNVRGMQKLRSLSRSVSTQVWSTFVNKLENKSVEYDTDVYKIDRFYPSSKMCSKCGAIKEDLSLSDRQYECECGASLDRDINAAINIRNYYLVNDKKSEDHIDYRRGEEVRPRELSFDNFQGIFCEALNPALAG